jgi:hypothetical protein
VRGSLGDELSAARQELRGEREGAAATAAAEAAAAAAAARRRGLRRERAREEGQLRGGWDLVEAKRETVAATLEVGAVNARLCAWLCLCD